MGQGGGIEDSLHFAVVMHKENEENSDGGDLLGVYRRVAEGRGGNRRVPGRFFLIANRYILP